MVLILQWNARSLVANGQEFKYFISSLPTTPDIICIQETWLSQKLDFSIYNYVSVRSDRKDGVGGGCATFIKKNIPFQVISKGREEEYIIIKIWTKQVKFSVVNYYNPCRRLDSDKLNQIVELASDHIVLCGDFNAHSSLWGGGKTDVNGLIIEQLLDEFDLVCINDGRSTRIDVHTGKSSALDLTLVSKEVAGICEWKLWEDSTMGSDHFPVLCKLYVRKDEREEGREDKWIFNKAMWGKFEYLCEVASSEIDLSQDIDEIDVKFKEVVLRVANLCIPKSKGKMNRKPVPWWTEECGKSIKVRNKAFKMLKNNLNFQRLIEYKKAQAQVRKVVKKAKRDSWREYCNKIGRTTPLGDVWGMIRKMRGIRKDWQYPVLKSGETIAVTNGEKAEIIAKALVEIHSSNNLSEAGKRGREVTRDAYPEALIRKESTEDAMDSPFTLSEMKRAIDKAKVTAPGKDQISYSMLKQFGILMQMKLLGLYNKSWEEGRLPISWKEAIIIPIAKPGKDPMNPANYRSIALMSHVGKIMEWMIVERMTFYIESKCLLSPYQSGFRKGRGTMDPVVCLETVIRKAMINKESVMAVFLDVEKAYDMAWKEGLLIKLDKMGIKGRTFNWVKSFLFERYIQVKIGTSVSNKFKVDNGTVMINDVFNKIKYDIGKSLFADDVALWKNGKSLLLVQEKIQKAVGLIEEWSYSWGFKFSVEK
ncbi:RNA-directed DNA polymerase from mobile element jockey [Labeo rohita]|uniref:RNA-directed DNA polymerase from mobile element jockey n=1 Tax=Labeo rohita TaxID=84645 RepID=A0ABQ8LZ67_LABRO|nr:RNA-directed DNA polymerase from mobile element jockey [Labeo rohita]